MDGEAGCGQPPALLSRVNDRTVDPHNPNAATIADALIDRSLMPEAARLDAMHVAVAALAGVQYLLTQNCTHIANAHVLPRVYKLLAEFGLAGLLIVTPIEFLGGHDA